jgi:hypothetical protein
MMFNGEMVREAISTTDGSLIGELAESGSSFPQCVEKLFWATLTRKPNSREKNMAKSFLAYRKGDAKEALKDVAWVLLNTNEFIFNH